MKIRRLSEETKKYIVEQAFSKTSTELSKELNISPTTIRAVWQRNNISKVKIFSPNKEEFIQKYKELKSSRRMSEYYNTSRDNIVNYAKKIGYDYKIPPVLNEQQIQEIISKYHTHTSVQLSKIYNVSSSKISQVWSQHGLLGKERRIYYLNNQNYFENIDTPQKAYLLGFIATDGCIHKPKQEKQDILRICIQENDKEILDLFKKELDTNKPIKLEERTATKHYVSLEISSQKIVDDIRALGIDYAKTYKCVIPNISKELFPHFIRGYFDGDGSIVIKDKLYSCSIVGYYRNLVLLKDFLDSKNIFCGLNEAKSRKYNSGKFGQLACTDKITNYCFLKLIYSDCGQFRLTRKYERAMDMIKSIEAKQEIRNKQIVIYYNYAVQKVCQ